LSIRLVLCIVDFSVQDNVVIDDGLISRNNKLHNTLSRLCKDDYLLSIPILTLK